MIGRRRVERRTHCARLILPSIKGHAIRKAAGELGKKRSGGAISSKTVSQLAMQKRQMSSQQPDNLDVAGLGLLGAGGLNSAFLNNPSLVGLSPSPNGMGSMGLGLGLGGYRADRATASFLRPTLNHTLLPTASSSFGASHIACFPPSSQDGNSGLTQSAGLGGNSSLETNELLLQSLQRQQLLINAAAQTQQQSMNLLGQPMPSSLSYLAGMNPFLLSSGLAAPTPNSLPRNSTPITAKQEEDSSTDDSDEASKKLPGYP